VHHWNNIGDQYWINIGDQPFSFTHCHGTCNSQKQTKLNVFKADMNQQLWTATKGMKADRKSDI